MSELKLLWEVQELDVQTATLETKLKEGQISGGLRALKTGIEEDRVLFNKLKGEYANNKKELRSKEMDVTAANEQIESLGQKLYGGGITNVKEINSSNKKLDYLKDKVQLTEDEILTIMERQDELRATLEELKTALNEKVGDYRQKHGSLLADQQNIRDLLDQIPFSRQKLFDQIKPALREKYIDMKKKFSDPLARVEKGICRGCRVGIPFNDLRLLKQGEGLVFCSYCGRMLYWEK